MSYLEPRGNNPLPKSLQRPPKPQGRDVIWNGTTWVDQSRCEKHPAFEADYCPSCGTSAVIR